MKAHLLFVVLATITEALVVNARASKWQGQSVTHAKDMVEELVDKVVPGFVALLQCVKQKGFDHSNPFPVEPKTAVPGLG